MKKNYSIPSLETIVISEAEMIAQSMKVGGDEKVSNSADIGFVKENTANQDYNVWDDDWSAEQ